MNILCAHKKTTHENMKDIDGQLDSKAFPKAFDLYLRYTRRTQAAMARALHCSVDTLNKWRVGEKLPNEQQLKNLKLLMGVKSADELNVPPPSNYQHAAIDGYTIEEWRRRALVAEMRLRRLQEKEAD